MPHRGAIDTSNWAALVMHPDTTFPNTNGSKAIDSDQCATLGHAFLINGGTTPQFPKQQEAAPSLFEGDHVELKILYLLESKPSKSIEREGMCEGTV